MTDPTPGSWRRWREFFAPPTFADEDSARLARVLNIILLNGLLALLLFTLATAAAGQYDRTVKMALGAGMAIILFFLLRGRFLRLTILLTFVVQLGLVTWILFSGGGIHELATMLYPITIVIAGLLLRKKEFLAIFLLSLLSAAFIIFSELTGRIDPSRLQKTSIYVLITVIAIFVLAAVAVRILANDLQRSRDRVRQHERELRESNLRLQQEVSERKQAEESLRESETRFRTLAESTFEGLCVSENGLIIDANSSLARMLACEASEIIGRRVDDFLEPEMRGIVARQMHAESDVSFEFMVRRLDGTLVPVESRSRTIPYQGRLVQVTTCHDLSERRRSEEEQRILEAEIRQNQKLESLGTLAGGIAHDFNNILSIISGHAAALSGKLKDNAEAQTALHTINEASERGSSMVRQILTFARKSEADFRALRIQDMVADLVKMLRVTFPRTIDISYSCPGDLPQVWMDPSQLHQALLNLCINARDAMAGTGKLEIGTRLISGDDIAARFPAAAGKRLVRIQVIDTGVGMDEKMRARIFEPFFTTKGRGRGTGLGLAVVYGVIRAHRGFVEVDSQPGAGAVFSLYFPASERQALPEPPRDSEELPSARGSETILVVEDEEDLRELLTSMLHDHGYSILVARDGLEALERYRRHRQDIQLVITDMDLPRLNGAAVSQSILSDNPGARIVMISGFLETALKESILASGVREFVAKPYTMPQMLQIIRKVLDED
jgi:PAS domain S-box-containing protein